MMARKRGANMTSNLPVRAHVATAHGAGAKAFATSGTWFTGLERSWILAEIRHARAGLCALCNARKAALSPYAEDGEHDTVTPLPPQVVEVVHRLSTDSGRVTQQWFSQVTSGELSAPAYVEIVGLIGMAMILDSFAAGIGAAPFALDDQPEETPPSRVVNPEVVDAGAWVPILRVDQAGLTPGQPSVPNIARSMGLVPLAVQQFFGVMRAHYNLLDFETSLQRAQIELIASRMSAYNDCFY